MDCVTCMLMGMCMLCGPGFGGSLHGSSSVRTGTATPGKPMTREEMTAALQNLLGRYDVELEPRSTPPPRISYDRRQSFTHYDPKFTGMGIGKRNKVFRVDPYSFSYGIGKRKVTGSNSLQGQITASVDDVDTPNRGTSGNGMLRELGSHSDDVIPIVSRSYDALNDEDLLSWGAMQSLPNFNTDLYKYIFNHMLERARLAKSKEFLEKERRKLRLRRQKHDIDPIFTMMGIGR